MAAPRRRKIGHRRRVEDEGEDEGGHEALDLDDDSLTDGSIATDDHDADEDSDTSNIDEASPTSPNARKSANGAAKPTSRHGSKRKSETGNKKVSDTEAMLSGLALVDAPVAAQELQFDEVAPPPAKSPNGPVVVSSSSANRQPSQSTDNRRRQEHDDYRRKRDEDPAFVPNRGAFFMHDHRHAGPSANGFRPFGRGRGRGGRGGGPGVGGPFSPMNQLHRPGDPTTSSPWTHDMHEAVAEPASRRPRQAPAEEDPPNGTGFIPTRESNPTPINRTLSTEKHIGNAQVRVFMPDMKTPIMKSGLAVKQYTKLPDHRPPLRRDKPVRISLPERPPRYVYPAVDRSFVFIPRAMRPNQQRVRGKGRSGLGSIGGFSRRTSVFGGSIYGSMYSPSIAMSRRSSFANERDALFSPTGSVISRSGVPVENHRPLVRLPPPTGRPDMVAGPPVDPRLGPQGAVEPPKGPSYPHPQPHYQENRPADLPMHQPRPQKNISVADIEPVLSNHGAQAYQGAFHQQVPMQVANGYAKEHTRQPSFMSQHSAGTPLSQIPERAIHAAPFQPNVYGQPPPYYNQQGYQPQPQPPQSYYYPQGFSGSGMPPPPANPAYGAPVHAEQAAPQHNPHAPPPNANLVAQEANGMVYYYDPNQLPAMNTSYPSYTAPPNFQPGAMGMGNVVAPSPDGYYYPQPTPGMLYYTQ
jgi:hypothetical protein